MARGGSGGRGGPVTLVKAGIKRMSGYLYFIDKQGDVACVKMSRGGRKKSKKKAAKKTKKKATKKKARRKKRK
jgi:hypothetical protein